MRRTARANRRRLKATKDKLERYGCAESTGKAVENLNAFEEASAEWGAARTQDEPGVLQPIAEDEFIPRGGIAG